jgi:hypothetical protein
VTAKISSPGLICEMAVGPSRVYTLDSSSKQPPDLALSDFSAIERKERGK